MCYWVVLIVLWRLSVRGIGLQSLQLLLSTTSVEYSVWTVNYSQDSLSGTVRDCIETVVAVDI
jgi:hypothetical protein